MRCFQNVVLKNVLWDDDVVAMVTDPAKEANALNRLGRLTKY